LYYSTNISLLKDGKMLKQNKQKKNKEVQLHHLHLPSKSFTRDHSHEDCFGW